MVPCCVEEAMSLSCRIWKERLGREGSHLTLASCFMRKSMKPKPLCVPIPAIFFGKHTIFSPPKVLGKKDKWGSEHQGPQRRQGWQEVLRQHLRVWRQVLQAQVTQWVRPTGSMFWGCTLFSLALGSKRTRQGTVSWGMLMGIFGSTPRFCRPWCTHPPLPERETICWGIPDLCMCGQARKAPGFGPGVQSASISSWEPHPEQAGPGRCPRGSD